MKYRFLGCNDDENICCLCGKTNLKKVIWLEDTETGDIGHFGCVCARKLQKISSEEFKIWLKTNIKENEKQAKIEFYNSKEFENYKNAMEYINIHISMYNIPENITVKQQLKKRFDYLEPYKENKKNKENEIKEKYHVKYL